MNLLLSSWLELALKDRSVVTISKDLADEILLDHSTEKDELVIEFLDNDKEATITTVERARHAITFRENNEKLKEGQAQLQRIDRAITNLATSLSAGNDAMFRMTKHIIKYQKPAGYLAMLKLSPQDIAFFKDLKFR